MVKWLNSVFVGMFGESSVSCTSAELVVVIIRINCSACLGLHRCRRDTEDMQDSFLPTVSAGSPTHGSTVHKRHLHTI